MGQPIPVVDGHPAAEHDERVLLERPRDRVARERPHEAEPAPGERLAQGARTFELFVLDDEDPFHGARGALACGPAARHPDAGSPNARLPMGYNATPGGPMALGKNFRLPQDVRPTRYRAELAPDLELGRFDGRMDIELSLARPRKEIVLHAIDLDLGRAEARASGKTIAADRIEADPESQTVTLRFAEEVPKGDAVVDLAWKGKFSPGLRGLYRAGPVAVTQFEAADARRLFPCF